MSTAQGDPTMVSRELRQWAIVPAVCGVLALLPAASGVAAQREGWTARVPSVVQGRAGYDNGFREGLRHGELDARSGRNADLNRHDAYRAGDAGHQRSAENRDAYRTEFRRGYTAGYRQAYDANRDR